MSDANEQEADVGSKEPVVVVVPETSSSTISSSSSHHRQDEAIIRSRTAEKNNNDKGDDNDNDSHEDDGDDDGSVSPLYAELVRILASYDESSQRFQSEDARRMLDQIPSVDLYNTSSSAVHWALFLQQYILPNQHLIPEVVKCCQIILSLDPAAATAKVGDNKVALHVAVDCRSPNPAIVQCLLEHAPETALVRETESGLLPIEIVNSHILAKEEAAVYRKRKKNQRQQSPQQQQQTSSSSAAESESQAAAAAAWSIEPNWECARLLALQHKSQRYSRNRPTRTVAAASSNSGSTSTANETTKSAAATSKKEPPAAAAAAAERMTQPQTSAEDGKHNKSATATPAASAVPILHACLAAKGIPLSLVERAIRRYGREQALLPDDQGNLPLHIVAAAARHKPKPKPSSSSSSAPDHSDKAAASGEEQEQEDDEEDDEDDDMLATVLALNPLAAQQPNHHGCLPLHLAIAAGRSWSSSSSQGGSSSGGVELLLEAYPAAVGLRRHFDAQSYPFVLSHLLARASACPDVAFAILQATSNFL